MRDLSSANVFQIGAKVKVVSSVIKAGVDLKGRIGIVQESWEKCEVDPTCCCAEFVDEHFAVMVKFDGPIDSGDDIIGGNENVNVNATSLLPIVGLDDHFTHYFAEEELLHVKDN